VEFTGRDVLYTNMGNNITIGLANSLSLAVFSIMGTMLLVFRSLRFTVVGLLVNLLPMVVTLAVMAAFGITLDMGTIMVADLGLGIAVDDTIHYLTHYKRRVGHRAAPPSVIQDIFCTIGMPLALTTGVLVMGFLVFLFADFMPNFYFGLLISVFITVGLACEFSLSPAILYLWARRTAPVIVAESEGGLSAVDEA